MARTSSRKRSLAERFPPSEPCTCAVCVSYCARPGWWTVEEAARALEAGYGGRMMLEMSPDRSFGVLAPAFRGNEVDFARQQFAANGCTFLKNERCELFGTGFQPLECRHVHHADPASGARVHAALEKDWNTPAGRALVVRWSKQTGFWDRKLFLMFSGEKPV
ncbi:MAG: hypothetical protein N2049_01765 [Anaerolineales bacterium]|nr:hypothetical protein [Anaerolineales bacterium]